MLRFKYPPLFIHIMTYSLSPHSINLYEECPRCFWANINENKKRPSGPFPSLPSGMDRVFKAHFDYFRKRRELPPELAELSSVHLFESESLLKKWRNDRSGLSWKDSDGNELCGSLDEVLETDEGRRLIVLDYKTRGFPLKEDTAGLYQRQLDIYNFILQQNGYDTEDYAFLLFFYPKALNRTGTVSFNKQLVKMPVDVSRAENAFENAIKLLKGPKPDLNQYCNFCNWNPE